MIGKLRRLSFKKLSYEIRSRWADLVGVGVFPLFGVLLALKWLFENGQLLFVYDDSYITLGFARNFALHGTLTLDGTALWYGMTSPLHAFLVSLLARLFGSVEASAIFVGMASIAFLVIAVYLWVQELTKDKKVALLASFLTASSGWVIFDALSGLETVTYILLSVLVFYFLEKRNVYLVGLFLGLSIWTRPEGWFLLGAVLISQLVIALLNKDSFTMISKLKRIGLEAGVAFALVVPLLLVSFAYTGAPVPSTALTKAYFFGEPNMALSTKAQFFWDAVRLWYGTLIFASPFVLVLLAFARYTWQRSYLYIYPLLFYAFYFILFPGSLGHYWCRYQHIFLPIVFLLFSEGAVNLPHLLRKRWKIIAVVLLAAVILLNQWQSLSTGQERYKGATASIQEVNIQLERWLEANTDANDVIAVHDIGTITYFLGQRKVIDLVGLINPEVTKYYREGATAVAFEERQVLSYLQEKEVDYLVMFDDWKRFLNLSPEDTSVFHLVYESEPIYGSNARYRVYSLSKPPVQR